MADKKKIIRICIIICVCVISLAASFCAGRYVRLGVLERDSARIDSTYTELTNTITGLESELAARVAECDNYIERLGTIESGLDGCLGDVRLMRAESELAGIEVSDIKLLLQELRRRYTAINDRSIELEERLKEYQKCAAIE